MKFDLGIFTNLSRDHLDYHKKFKDYFESKMILFRKLMKKKSSVIFDEDLNIVKKIISISKKNNLEILSIGRNSKLKIIEYKFANFEQQIKFLYKNSIHNFSTKLIGKVQIKNLMMSILAATKCNISMKNI